MAQNNNSYSLFYSTPYFEPKTINPIHGSYYLEGLQANELMYSRLWTWKKDLSETSDLVANISQQSFNKMLKTPQDNDYWSWLVEIRPGLKWPDGKPLTAEDVKFSFDVYVADKTEYSQRELLKIFKKITIVDDHTIQFFVEEKNKRIVRRVLPLVQILPKHKVVTTYLRRESKFNDEPMGSGPYQYTLQDKRNYNDKGNSKIVFSRNKNYYNWGSNSNIDYIKILVERNLPDIVQRILKSQRSEDWLSIDLLINTPNDIVNYEKIQAGGKDHLKFIPYSSNSWYGIAINTEKPYLNNRDVRLALTHAIDIQQIIKDNYAKVNVGSKPEPIAERVAGPFNPEYGVGDMKLLPKEYDLEKAKEYLEGAGPISIEDGKPYYKGKEISLKLIYSTAKVLDGSAENIVVVKIQNYIEKLQIKINLVKCSAKDYNKKLANSDYDLAFQHIELGSGSNIEPLFRKDSPSNTTRFSNPLLTDYLVKFNRAATGKQKKEYGKKIHKIVYDEAPYIYLYQLKKIMTIRDELITDKKIVPRKFFPHIGSWYFSY